MTTKTSFEEGTHWILDTLYNHNPFTNIEDVNRAKASLTQLHEAAIVDELYKIQDVQGFYKRANYIDDRIAALKSKEKE